MYPFFSYMLCYSGKPLRKMFGFYPQATGRTEFTSFQNLSLICSRRFTWIPIVTLLWNSSMLFEIEFVVLTHSGLNNLHILKHLSCTINIKKVDFFIEESCDRLGMPQVYFTAKSDYNADHRLTFLLYMVCRILHIL